MSKLQNVKAVQQLLAGTHKTQTRQSHYYGKSITEIDEDNIIEKFENGKPRIWIETDSYTNVRTRVTQNEGFKSRESESGYLIRQAQKDLLMPTECPNCGTLMHNKEKKLNKKFWPIHKECFGCVIKKESILVNDEKAWNLYQREKMYENAKAFFNDADEDVKGLEKIMTQAIRQVQNADGDIETFEASLSKEKFKDTVLKKYKEYKKKTLKELKDGK
tara:strand:- start:835 stop:1488 length:654 start_codon:yes stop_codon:yes gene_type:complete